jgi:hypothetical protein
MANLGMTDEQEQLFIDGELMTIGEATELLGLARRTLLLSPIDRIRTIGADVLFDRESLYERADRGHFWGS